MIGIEALVFNDFQVNTYLVWDDSGNCLVIDPAFYTPEEAAHFDAHIIEKGFKVAGQINTHCHIDHILGVKHLRLKYGCPFRAHREDENLAKNAPLMGDVFGLSVDPLPGIDETIEDNAAIAIGTETLLSIHVPGHSPGSLAYYSRQGGFVITGDALFRRSIGRTDLPGGNYDQLIHSIESRLLTLPPETIVYPGHGPSTSILEEATENPYISADK